MKIMKKLNAVLAVLMASTLIFASCGRGAEPAPTPTPTPTPTSPVAGDTNTPPVEVSAINDANVNPAGVYPIFKEPVTITIGTQQNATVTDYADNYLTRYLEEVGNVKIEWEIFPSATDDALQAIAVRVAAGHPLPDVLMGFDFVPAAILNYGQNGVFHNVAPYFDHLAPNFHERVPLTMEGFDSVVRNMTSADGGIYFIPRINEELPAIFPQRMLINERMLHEIGWSNQDASIAWDKSFVSRYPTTTDELLYVLRAFRDLDPANNIPMIGSTTMAQNAIAWVMNAFVYDSATVSNMTRLIQNDGVLNVAYVTEEWRDGLRFLNQLYNENLLSGLSFTSEGTDIHRLGAAGDRNTIGMAMVGGASAAWRDALSPNFNDGDDARVSEYRGMPNIAGPNGVSNTTFQEPAVQPFWVITSNAVSPEGLFRLGDHQLSYESTMRSRFGPLGMSWDYYDGPPMLTETGYPVVRFIDDDIHERAWTASQNIIFRFRNPGIMLPEMAHSWRPAGQPNFWSSDGFVFNEAAFLPHMPTTHVPNLAPLYTVQEMERIQHIINTLESFVEEHTALFITGELDIETQWENYLASINAIGLPVFLQTAQDAYDRLMGQ